MAQDALIRIKAKVSGQQEIKGLERQFKETESKAKRLKRQFGELGGAGLSVGKSIASAAAAFATFDAAIRQTAESIQTSIERASSTRRLEVLSQGFDDFEVVLGVASRAAEKFNLSQTNAQKSVAQLYARLRPLGVSLSEVESAYAGFNTAAILSGATATESAGALLQLSQALGAGALRGEEFNSVSEQAPAVIRAIGAELDVPVGRLKEMAANGEITADIVLAALQRIEKEGADQLSEAMDSPIQKFQTLQNRIEDLRVAFADLALPSLLDFVTDLADETERWTRAFNGLGKIVNDFTKSPAFVQLNNFLTGLQNINKIAQLVGPLGPISSALGRNPILEQLGQFAPEDKQPPKPEKPTTPLSTRLGIDPKAVETGKALKEITQEQYEIGLQIIEAERKGQDFKVIELQLTQDFLALEQRKLGQRNTLLRQSQLVLQFEKDIEKTARAAGKAMADMLIEDQNKIDLLKKGIEDFNKSLADMIPAITPIDQLFKDIGQSITANVAGAIEATIFEAQTLQESLSGILRSVASLLINFGTKSLLGGLFPSANGNVFAQNKIVPFANGGIINRPTIFPLANGAALAGEAGPEAIMPLRRDASGRLGVEASGGGVTVGAINITVENTGDQLNPAAQKQIAGQVQGLVLSTLANERRSGGMLG
jgi:tape measure domain-containing protein